MNVIEALAIAFWIIVFAIVIGVVSDGGWSGLYNWVAAKFGPVGASAVTPKAPGSNLVLPNGYGGSTNAVNPAMGAPY